MKHKTLVVVLALIFLEWLDFTLYLYLAKSVFASRFFPPNGSGLFLSFALFAAAYLARPLGGWVFGKSADRSGRRTPLILSAALMGGSTIGIAVLPGYDVLGTGATWLLLMLRLGQGLALGGEVNNSGMFIVEHQSKNPLVAGSFVAASGALGMFAGGATAALLQMIQIDWLWRVIFVLVGFTSLWVCRLRKKLQESPEFTPDQTRFRHILKEEWRGLLNIALLGAFVSVTVYISNAFWVSYASDQGFWSPANCAWAGSISQLGSALLALPIARYCAPDKVNLLVRTSMITAFIGIPLLFLFTTLASIPGVLIGLGFYIVTNGILCSGLYYFLYLQLPARYRCRGVSTIWALAASIGAISLPIAEQAYIHQMPWFAPLSVNCIALIGLLFLCRKPLKPLQTYPA